MTVSSAAPYNYRPRVGLTSRAAGPVDRIGN